MSLQTEILIVGGGLSGLYLAHQLEQQGRDYLMVEARSRFGGRIFSPTEKIKQNHYDMGPAWFWPGQPRIARLLQEFGIPYFDQASRGNLVFEDPSGKVRRDLDMATMEGAHRVEGSLARLIDALLSRLPKEKLQLSSPVQHIEMGEDEIQVTTEGTVPTISAKQVLLCIPPRLAEHRITFLPDLPQSTKQQMRSCPTWMATHAKFIAVYETPFWREMGLSADAISHKGPMMELHDASPQSEAVNEGYGAIFGFLGVPAEARKGQDAIIIEACKQQLINLFGERAASPIEVFYKDWSMAPYTATKDDANGPKSHPHYHTISISEGEWQNRLFFAATETAPQFGGFLEGALEAVDNIIRKI
ncbi:MAG: FAD-dependent oxidoreductase [Rhizobiaceae bacterium]|nr:FAD-dependent oxidoreductase [Rhizobiaceae bacterium]